MELIWYVVIAVVLIVSPLLAYMIWKTCVEMVRSCKNVEGSQVLHEKEPLSTAGTSFTEVASGSQHGGSNFRMPREPGTRIPAAVPRPQLHVDSSSSTEILQPCTSQTAMNNSRNAQRQKITQPTISCESEKEIIKKIREYQKLMVRDSSSKVDSVIVIGE